MNPMCFVVEFFQKIHSFLWRVRFLDYLPIQFADCVSKYADIPVVELWQQRVHFSHARLHNILFYTDRFIKVLFKI